MTADPFIYWLFTPPQLLPTLRQMAVTKLDGGEAERLNFGVAICTVAAPTVIVAYGGSSGPVDQSIVDYLEALLLSNPALQNVSWARIENVAAPARVLSSSHAPTQARINAGELVYWDMDKAMTDVGMQLYRPPGMP